MGRWKCLKELQQKALQAWVPYGDFPIYCIINIYVKLLWLWPSNAQHQDISWFNTSPYTHAMMGAHHCCLMLNTSERTRDAWKIQSNELIFNILTFALCFCVYGSCEGPSLKSHHVSSLLHCYWISSVGAKSIWCVKCFHCRLIWSINNQERTSSVEGTYRR